ncbi:hypothetical protein MMC25_007873 [Agyrium rufum]|nr:hypothetical protein [Agyrium rufum]
MTTQAAIIADTIAGMRKVLRVIQANGSESDEAYDLPINRGNKLKRRAQFSHEGRLGGRLPQKRKIEHASYSRTIISRIPKRYDAYGDELSNEEDDSSADADVADRNPYNDIKLEEILRPLTSAAELPRHPALSIAYTSPMLTEMVHKASQTVHRERQTLAHIKRLAMAFRGDNTWATGDQINAATDRAMFGMEETVSEAIPGSSALVAIEQNDTPTDDTVLDHNSKAFIIDVPQVTAGPENTQIRSLHIADDNLSTQDPPNLTSTIGSKAEGVAAKIFDDASSNSQQPTVVSPNPLNISGSPKLLPEGLSSNADDQAGLTEPHVLANNMGNTANVAHHPAGVKDIDQQQSLPPRRMTTRAQAQAASEYTAVSTNRSTSPGLSETSAVHPLFNINPDAVPDINYGLPPGLAEDARISLFLWVQKQEEVVRGAIRLYEGLLKADTMRKSVMSWCKAEAHLGEFSDNEDWYDKEEWGLEENLAKGQLEEEDEGVHQGKKTRGRRAQ